MSKSFSKINNIKILAILLFLIVLLIGSFSINNPFFFDDVSKIVRNPDIQDLNNLPHKLIYPYDDYRIVTRNDPSRPIVYLIYTLLYSINQADPIPFRAFLILTHAMICLLLFSLFYKMQSNFLKNDSLWPSFVAALFFACSPTINGTILYIYALNDVLFALFTFCSFYFFTKNELNFFQRNLLSALFMILALGCKQTAIIIPFLFLAFEYIFAPCRKLISALKKIRIYILISLIYFIWRYYYFGGVGDLEAGNRLQPWSQYSLVQPTILWLYFLQLIIPYNLTLDHFLRIDSIPISLQIFSILLWVSLFIYLFYSFYTKNHKILNLGLFGFLWYIIVLSPTSSFLPTVDVMVERRAYPGLVFLIFFMAYYFLYFLKFRPQMIFLTISMTLLLGFFSIQRAICFQDPYYGWQESLSIYPISRRAMLGLAEISVEQKDFNNAQTIYNNILKSNNDDVEVMFNLANVLTHPKNSSGDLDLAKHYLMKAIELRPSYSEAYYNLGLLLHYEKKLDEAEKYYNLSLKYNSRFAPCLNNLAIISIEKKDFLRARELLLTTLNIDPNYTQARINLNIVINEIKK